MRFKLFSALAILLLAGSNDARPPKVATPEVVAGDSPVATGAKDDSSWRPIEPRSSSAVQIDSRSKSPGDRRETKDLRTMDQSLRTVATQLLNVTNPDDPTAGNSDKTKLAKGELPPNVLLLRKSTTTSVGQQQNFDGKTKSDMELVREINSEISSLESMGIGFGRPTNSKFGYFESSHPGQAMAMTEEELEREMATSSTRLITAHKNNHPTTTGGISTWILLNSPTTTSRPMTTHRNDDEENNKQQDDRVNVQIRLQTKVTTPVKVIETTLKTDTKTAASTSYEDKATPVETTTPMQKIVTLTKSTTPVRKKTTLTTKMTATTTTTTKPVKTTPKTEQTVTLTSLGESTKLDEVKATTPKPAATKKQPTSASSRPTPKPKVTTPKPANVTSKPMMTTKLGRPSQGQKPKSPPPRKATSSSSPHTTKSPSTSKIEKVTFRPVQLITTPKSLVESVERPTFVTKIKTSLVADANSKTTSSQSVTTSTKVIATEDNSELTGDFVEVKAKPQPAKTTNNVLKVQLKKPSSTTEAPPTKIEIEPIKVNTPVLRIEKIEDKEKSTKKNPLVKTTTPADILDNSRIDLKFDFNPELTRIEVEETSTIGSTTSAASTTSKRPKRKKNKVRRRKPTTSTSSTSIALPTDAPTSVTTIPAGTTDHEEVQEILTELGIIDNAIQESKVVPESKVSSSNTKNKKKQQQQQVQVQKPIGTQIYNFLSREVMPSFGVMSLVGLGLGLASYFLYPFGGVIARRNYVVEPNYKYNLDEYGGNYGQNEEEVFSKVLQGMTSQDGKYGGIKDYENNFHRYQHFDAVHNQPHTTRKSDPRYPTSAAATVYRPIETTIYDSKFRNTEFKYPDVPTTPNYYERRKQQEFQGKKPGPHGDRRFVVGNVPKEYGFADKGHGILPQTTPPVLQADSNGQEMAQNHKFVENPTVDVSTNYDRPEAQALKGHEGGYEEIEITPAAVAVEHGPRSMDLESSVQRSRLLRKKRESVIQLIPSRTEIEKEEEEIEKEEPLSNEILDIIDSVIPEDAMGVGKIVGIVGQEKKEVKKAAGGDNGSSGQASKKDFVEATTRVEGEAVTAAKVEEASSTEPSSLSASTEADSTTTTTTVPSLTIDEILGSTASSNPDDSSVEWFDRTTTEKPHEQPLGVFGYVKKIAEVKLRLGLAILKHATEGFARYLGHIQKRVNGEE